MIWITVLFGHAWCSICPMELISNFSERLGRVIGVNPAKLNSTSDCLVCGQCIKSCAPFNMTLLLRRPFHPADYREPLASWPLTIFIMLVSGFVTYELCTEWDQAKHVFLWIPQQLSSIIGLNTNNGWIKGFWTLFIFQFLLWSFFGAIVKMFEFNTKFTTIWRRLALPLVIVISAGHMVKGIAKFVSWVDFLPYTIRVPFGFKTVHQFTSGILKVPAPIIDKFAVSIIGIVIMLIILYFAIREFRLAHNESRVYWLIPKFILNGVFLLIISGW